MQIYKYSEKESEKEKYEKMHSSAGELCKIPCKPISE